MKRLLLLLFLIACSVDPCDLNKDGTVDMVERKRCMGETPDKPIPDTTPDTVPDKPMPDTTPDTTPDTVPDTDETGSLYEAMPASGRVLDLPIYLTTMTHMEGSWQDDTDEDLFNVHANQARFFMNLAIEHDAKITVESELPFATGNVVWDDNVMLDLAENGMGVGTHCDIGAMDKGMTQYQFVELLRRNKEAVDALVGAENNLGCSGAGSHLDWVTGMQDAGFTYVNGIVGFHLQAIPEAYRPAGYTDQAINKEGYFHHHVPTDLYDRTYLRYLADTQDLMGDTSGLVMSAGSLGKLSSMAEGGYEAGVHIADGTLQRDDVDTLVEVLRDIDENRDRGYVSKVDLYFPSKELVNSNREVLIYFFEEMEALQDDGVIEWATQKEVVETFIAYN